MRASQRSSARLASRVAASQISAPRVRRRRTDCRPRPGPGATSGGRRSDVGSPVTRREYNGAPTSAVPVFPTRCGPRRRVPSAGRNAGPGSVHFRGARYDDVEKKPACGGRGRGPGRGRNQPGAGPGAAEPLSTGRRLGEAARRPGDGRGRQGDHGPGRRPPVGGHPVRRARRVLRLGVPRLRPRPRREVRHGRQRGRELRQRHVHLAARHRRRRRRQRVRHRRGVRGADPRGGGPAGTRSSSSAPPARCS